MKATFDNSVSILVKAYLNDTLVPMACEACAVGNLVASGMNYTFEKTTNGHISWVEHFNSAWDSVVVDVGIIKNEKYTGRAKREIESTGYTCEQLAIIEDVFMKASNASEWGNFEGLMAVVDYLAIIHEVDLTAKDEAKKMFVKI